MEALLLTRALQTAPIMAHLKLARRTIIREVDGEDLMGLMGKLIKICLVILL